MKQWDKGVLGKRVLLGAGMTAVMGFGICCLLAAVVLQEWIPMEMGKTMALLLTNGILAVFCWMAVRKLPSNRLLISVAVAVVYWLLCFLGRTVLFGDKPIQMHGAMALPIVAAVTAGFVASMEKTRRR